jgi:hypothetical protein
MKARKPNVPKYLYAKFLTQANSLSFWNKYWIFCSLFEIKRNHKDQYDYNSIKDLTHYIWIFKLNDIIICSCFKTKEIKKFNVIVKVNVLFK